MEKTWIRLVGSSDLEKDSNMNLLRILCMFFVVLQHFIVFGAFPGLFDVNSSLTADNCVATLLLGLTVVGVNCFVLISGYYQIHFKIRGLFNLYLICVFYAAIGCIFYRPSSVQETLATLFLPFSHSQWWFVQCYVILYLFSPLLNHAVDSMTKRSFVIVLLLLTVVNVYFGYWWHFYNKDGYNVAQFVYLYFIGAYLRKHVTQESMSHWRIKSVVGYFLFAMLWGILVLVSHRHHIPHWVSDSYNNPFVLLASVCLFVGFVSMKLKSKGVNVMAKSVLAAYLLQVVLRELPYSLLNDGIAFASSVIDSSAWLLVMKITLLILGSVLFVFLSCAFDGVRLLLMKPVWVLYDIVSRRVRSKKEGRHDS